MIAETDPGTPAVVWFRKDLRLLDNPSLHAALLAKRKIIPVFVWDPDEAGQWSPGAASRWWLHHAIESLAKQILGHQGELILAKGKAAELIPEIAKSHGAKQVYYSRVYDPAGIETQENVEVALDRSGIGSESFNASLLQEPWVRDRQRERWQSLPVQTWLRRLHNGLAVRCGQPRRRVVPLTRLASEVRLGWR